MYLQNKNKFIDFENKFMITKGGRWVEGRFDMSRDADPGAKDEPNGSWFRAVRP